MKGEGWREKITTMAKYKYRLPLFNDNWQTELSAKKVNSWT